MPVVGVVLFSLGYWSANEFDKYAAAIGDARAHVGGKVDLSLLFLMVPEQTLANTRSKKKSFTRDPSYLRALYSEYSRLVPDPMVRALVGQYSLDDACAFFAQSLTQPS